MSKPSGGATEASASTTPSAWPSNQRRRPRLAKTIRSTKTSPTATTLRPVSVILALQKQLSVSVEGYLRIEADQHIDIVGISTQIPLK